MKWAGVRTIVGYTHPGRGWLLDEAVEPLARQQDQRWVAREEHVLGLMRSLGCPDLGTALSLPTAHLSERRSTVSLLPIQRSPLADHARAKDPNLTALRP